METHDTTRPEATPAAAVEQTSGEWREILQHAADAEAFQAGAEEPPPANEWQALVQRAAQEETYEPAPADEEAPS